MELTLKYFGMIADITQKKEEVFFMDNDSVSLEILKSKIEIDYPKILDVNYSVAINKKFANCDTELEDQDEVAFMPPFAGG